MFMYTVALKPYLWCFLHHNYVCLQPATFFFHKKKKEEDGKVLTLCNIMHFYYTYFKVSFIKTYLQTWRETKLEQYRFVSRVYYCIYTVSTMKPA